MNAITNDSSMSGSFLSNSFSKKVSGKLVDQVTENKSCCPTLTLKQRVIGYAVCTGIGNNQLLLFHIFFMLIYTLLYRIHYKSFIIWYSLFSSYWQYCKIRHSIFFWHFIKYSRVILKHSSKSVFIDHFSYLDL